MYINKDKIQGKLSVLGEGIQGGFFFFSNIPTFCNFVSKTGWGRQTHRHTEWTWGCRGGGGSGMDVEFRVSRYKLLHLEWIHNEVLLYSPGNWIQSLGIDRDRR